jgi:acyl-CoA reductase-like NAD-dependent aldehyde dehydrogenase
MRSLINPLAGGNCVILKTSEFSPKSHLAIAQLFLDAGLPAGVLNVVHIKTQDAPAVVEALIEDEAVRKVNFTGSTRVGRMISQTCASNLKPVVLELGGKAPVIVCEDADIDLAANNIIFGGLMNQGQICMATANIVAHKNISAKLESTLADLMKQNARLRASSKTNPAPNPEGTEHVLRGLFTTAAAERVKGLYDDAIKSGAKVVAGTEGFDTKLGVIQPIFVKADEKMQLYKEETFAPIIGIFEFTTEEEALEKANAPGAGLSSSVFSKDETKAWRLARGIDSGAVHINGITVHDEQSVPHGGFKSSGSGRFNGRWGIEEFCYLKTVTITPGIHYPFFVM